MTRALLLFCFSLVAFTRVSAEVRLPAILSSNMVLQRNTTAMLWGWAEAGEEITIRLSWQKKPLKVTADASGRWKVGVVTTDARDAQRIEFTCAHTTLSLVNVLFGEVWLCSGQSNMQQPLKGFPGQPTLGGNEAIAKSGNPNLRLFTVGKMGAEIPLDDLGQYTPWQEASPQNAADFSSVAYFFGQQLQEILDVPVGLIHASWGSSSIQTWMSRESLGSIQSIKMGQEDAKTKGNMVPTALFNGMIHPLIPFTVKGMIWYQGEANRAEPERYKKLFPAMVADWRARWAIGDFPVFFVQIATFPYGRPNAFQQTNNSAFMREAQVACVDLINNSGIAITLDLGDSVAIHPPKKKEVADRLVYNALSKTYLLKEVDGTSPQFDTLLFKDDKLLLKFKYAGNGLYAPNGLQGFEIAGNDRVFYPANAKIVNERDVLVWSDRVPEPKAVRYAWRNWTRGSLYDASMLPASSFRTDDWEDATLVNEK